MQHRAFKTRLSCNRERDNLIIAHEYVLNFLSIQHNRDKLTLTVNIICIGLAVIGLIRSNSRDVFQRGQPALRALHTEAYLD